MTIYAAPSSTVEASLTGAPSGLVGTLAVRLLDQTDGSIKLARHTTGIVEQPADSGVYVATFTAPSTQDRYSLIWDDGSTFTQEDLVVTYSLPEIAVGPAFAAYPDLENRLGAVFDVAEQTRATALLADASDLVRQAARQEISLHLDDVLTLRGYFDGNIVLPERPVLAVSDVSWSYVDGSPTPIDPDSYYLDGDDLVMRGYRHQTPFDIGGGWYGPDYAVIVTYDHGYAVTPTLAKAITVEAVARVWMNPFGAAMSMMAGTQMQFTHQGLALTPDEEMALAKAFRRTKYSVQLR